MPGKKIFFLSSFSLQKLSCIVHMCCIGWSEFGAACGKERNCVISLFRPDSHSSVLRSHMRVCTRIRISDEFALHNAMRSATNEGPFEDFWMMKKKKKTKQNI